jgi:hypothetical protein
MRVQFHEPVLLAVSFSNFTITEESGLSDNFYSILICRLFLTIFNKKESTTVLH